MSFFYDLNKKLNSIGNEQEQIAKEVAKAAKKSPVRKSLEESLRSDMKALMEDGTGGMNFSGSGSLEENPTPEQAKLDPRYKTDLNFRKEVDAASQIGTNPNSLKETDKWIQKATKPSTKGDLHKALHVPQGKTIPKAKINKATHSKDEHLRHMAQFAKNIAHEDQEMECDTPVPAKGIPGNVPVKGKMDRLKGKRDYYETDDSDEDIMAYLNRKLASHDKEQAKENAMSKPYNGSKGDADAYNGMEFEGAAMPPPDVPQAAIIAPSPDAKYQVQKPQAPQVKTDMSKIPNDILQKAVDGGYPDANPALIAAAKTELANRMSGASSYNPTVHNPTVKEVSKNGPHGKPGWLIDAEKRAESEIDETMTRQHFQHTADLLKHIEDPAKRMELAKHHAGVFKASNPRFDHGKFMKACNCDEGLLGTAAGAGLGYAAGSVVDHPYIGAALGGLAGYELSKDDDKKETEEGIAGQAAGTIAGGALGGPVGAAIGGAIGNNLTNEEDFEEGWDDAMAAGKAAANQKPAYSRHTRRDVAPGRAVYTRNLDDEPEDDDDKDAPAHRGGKPRGRGRPVGTKGATGSRGPTGKSKLMARDAIGEENVAEVCHHCGQAIQEKAVSKKQQKFMGMVHAAQKGEKPASKEVAKVAKGMKKKDAEDFASTKHKGLPEKVKSKKTEEGKGDGNLANNAKPYDKVTRGDVVAGRLGKDEEGGKKKFKKEEKVDETTTSGSVTTAKPKASKSNSMGIGQGIYDSWNRSIESMISENINVNTTATKNDDGQDHESLTITVDGDDVGRFKELLQHMGISQNQDNSYKPHADEPCGSCGGVPCQCEEIADEGVLGTLGGAVIGGALGGPVGAAVGAVGGQELTKGGSGIIEADAPVSQNSPDYPTNQEESDDALQYSGGLNGKKSTGQSTIPVLASQEERQMSESNSFLDLYKAFSKIGK